MLQQEEMFWRDYLGNLVGPTVIGNGHAAAEGEPVSACLALDLPKPASGDTLEVLACAAWARLLATYSGDRHVSFGIEADRVVRIHVHPAMRVATLLEEVRRHRNQVLSRRWTPASRLLQLSAMEPGTRLWDSAIRTGDDVATTHDATAVLRLDVTSAHVSLTCRAGRMDKIAVGEVVEQFRDMLYAMAGPHHRTVHELPVVSGRFSERALHTWNDTAQAFDTQLTLHGMVERQAAVDGNQLAVVAEDGQLTYAELDRRANQLARHLRVMGVRPGDKVGICTEKSTATVVGMIGIMKAGAAYVPIDPGYPGSRIEYMVADARIAVLLTWGSGAAATAGLALPRVDLGHDWHEIAVQPEAAPEFTVPADALAYAIYTSGSTGQPKCALLNHRGRVNNIEDYCRRLSLTAADRVLCVSSLSFDISVCNIFCMFRAGGCVVFPDLDRQKDAEHWLELIDRHAVSFWHSAPALMDALIDATEGRVGDYPSLRVALLGGDWIPLAQPDRARAAFPGLWFVTAGGATELSIDSVFYPVDGVDTRWKSIPYGRPLANQSALILDADLALVPPGVPGELLLGGAGMGTGYLSRPGLTAEKFVAHPWPSTPGERLYRTGDLARYLPDGTIELLGRMDFQVKIRGVRIELGELEATLSEHPGVAACLAGAPRDVSGDPRLTAYVVARGLQDDAFHDELRAWLASRLPAQLVPDAFVSLDRLPLTPNGKVDRKGLPVPDRDAFDMRAYEPPRGDTEQRLAGLWQEVLGHERIGRHDGFLALGGHSLRMVRLRTRIRRAFGVDMSMGALAGASSLSAMAVLIQAAAPAASDGEPLARRTHSAPALSFAQRRMWFSHQLHDTSSAYNMPKAWTLRGKIDLPALQSALTAVLTRHEGLRSRVESLDGDPVLRIDPPGTPVRMVIDDLRGDPDQEASLAAMLIDEVRRPFRLADDALVRARWIRMTDDEGVLCLVQHHIVSDGWSYQPLLRDIGSFYAAAIEGKDAALPSLPLQYPDHAAWEIARLDGVAANGHAAFWSHTLAGAPAAIQLPVDRPYGMVPLSGSGSHPLRFDAQLTRSLQRVARRSGTTLFSVVLAAWSVVLSRLSGQEDVVIGTVTANRLHADTEALVGLFVNTLPLRVDLRGEPTLAGLLARVGDVVMAAQDHGDMPFDRIVELARVDRIPGRSALVQAVLAWQSHDEGALALHGLSALPIPVPMGDIRFELELTLSEQHGEIVGDLAYATALFDDGTMARHAGYLHRVLQAMASDSATTTTLLPLVDETERQFLLEDLNRSDTPYDNTAGIHELIARIAGRHAETVAMSCDGRRTTYAELHARATRLSLALREAGACEEDIVAVAMPLSDELVVTLLAIWKAGAAYLPLDPSQPADRLASIVVDADARLLLFDGLLPAPFTASLPSTVRPMDVRSCTPTLAADEPETVIPAASRLAYVIYTSGSTGMPKGVLVEHGSLGNLVAWHARRFGLRDGSFVACMAGVGFDASAWEIWSALAAGATLLLPPAHGAGDATAALAWWAAQPVEATFLVSPLAAVAVADGALPATLRELLIGGDRWLPPARPLPAGVTLVNNYGPTEATVVATSGSLRDTIHIGRPIANARIYLLDAHGEPVPFGASGEIYIGGAGVARGYLNRPDLTASCFLHDPFDRRPGARMYRTGDLARYAPNGDIVFVGRVDDQVKLRGYRIEPGEVQAVLASHPGIREAFINIAQDDAGEPRLLGYYTVHGDAPTDLVSDLHAHLAARLPDYMRPSALVALPILPVTANGKVDRRALPEPTATAFLHHGDERPAGTTEVALAAIWADLLGLDDVRRDDHFFELGGHSLAAVKVCSRVARQLGAHVSLSTIFAHPTLRALAAATDASRTPMTGDMAPITAESEDGALSLSSGQQRLWFLCQFDQVNATYNIPLAFEIDGPLDVQALCHAFAALVSRHAVLRTYFPVQDGQPEARVRPDHTSVMPVVHDVRGASTECQAAFLRDEAALPFDLASGPLVRAHLLCVGEERHRLLVTLHHMAADEWSLGILARELAASYAARIAGHVASLPRLDIQYHDYARWQRQWLTTGSAGGQEAYWRKQLTGAPPLLTLPTDRNRPGVQTYDGDVIPVRFDRELAQGIRTLSRQHGATPFITVLTAWSIVLSRLCGEDDLVIGTPVSNRHVACTEPLIGFFLNTLPLRIDLGGEPDVAELLGRAVRLTLDAQEHGDLPVEQIVEIVNPPRRLDHTPLFQVILAWRTHGEGTLELAGCQTRLLPLEGARVNFDLELSLGETGGELCGGLAYATALFDRATIERHVGYLERTLRAMVADASQPVTRIAMLSPAERHGLLELRNMTHAPRPQGLRAHEGFERHAAHAPDATALVFEGSAISYGRLNSLANRLAHRCIALGAGPGTRIALCATRGPSLVIGMLAAHKAGSAYVPMDPAYPAARLEHVLVDAAPVIVMHDAAGQAALPDGLLSRYACLDLDAPQAWSEQPDTNPDPRTLGANDTDAAYVIYTSGTTGLPKGVVVEHRQLVNFLYAMAKEPGISMQDRLLAVTSMSFDIAGLEIHLPLSHGAALVLASRDDVANPSRLRHLLHSQQITVMQATPAGWRALLDAPGQAPPERLRVLCGGEALSPALASRLCQQFREVWNLYGPTETTVWSTVARVDPVMARTATQLSIGRPIANTRIYLLDRHGEPVPFGSMGELYIGGDGVARGYHDRPGLTAQRFLHDPFATDGSRMYRTGDQARYLPGGELEFLGRNDHQVKIRGYRIEPGEIENRLREHAIVRDAVVLVREQGDDRRLVAYLLVNGEDHVADAAATLKLHLAMTLPAYMIPTAYVALAQWPLTPNGKLDRAALPAPGDDAVVQRPYVAPEGDTETELATWWCELLAIEKVGRHDDFFDLGGHSLLAVQLLGRIEASFGVRMDPTSLFRHPTLALLSRQLLLALLAQEFEPDQLGQLMLADENMP